MDWFQALEGPTQVALVGVLTAIVVAMGGVGVAIFNNRKAGGGRAEIAALTLDSTAVKQVAAALEAINVTMTEQNKLIRDGLAEGKSISDRVIREVEQLHQEVRNLADKLRAR